MTLFHDSIIVQILCFVPKIPIESYACTIQYGMEHPTYKLKSKILNNMI